MALVGSALSIVGLLRLGRTPVTHYASAPQLVLSDLNGQALRMSDYKGKVIVVNFWAAWCVPCADEIPQFMSLQEKYSNAGLQTIGISIDDDDRELRQFCRKLNVNYPVVKGNHSIADAYGGILGLPTTFLVGRDGRIHAKYVGSTDFHAVEREITVLMSAQRT